MLARNMIGLIQRVRSARVEIDGNSVAEIGPGLLVFVCARQGDSERTADRLLERILGYRIFPDSGGKMNRSVRDISGGVLLVPQFTLAADTSSGMRPSLGTALAPEPAERLFRYLAERAGAAHGAVACGRFGADMQVSLVNDGPVTFWLEVPAGTV